MFLRPAAAGCYQVDKEAARDYLEDAFDNYDEALSGITALTIGERVVGRGRNWFLVEGKPEKDLASRIQENLANAFQKAEFEIEIMEI